MREKLLFLGRGFATFAPLKIVFAYILISFAIAVLGPVRYVDFDQGRTVLFILSVLVTMFAGYALGVRSLESHRPPLVLINSRHTLVIFDASLRIALLALGFAISSAALTGSINTNLSNMGDAYVSGYEGYTRNSGTYSTTFLLYSLSLPFTMIASVWGIFYYSELDRRRRMLTLILVIGGLLFYLVGTGKQKQFGDVLIYLIAISLVKYGIRGRHLSFRSILRALLGSIFAIGVFVAVLSQRYAATGIGAFNINERVHPRMVFDIEHPVFKIFGPDYGFGLSVFSSYLSQGYYGLALSLGADWEWTRMAGFSYSLSVIFNRFLGFEWQWPNTIVYKVGVTTGWGESKWHTAFSHFASDFTWPGTVLLFGFFAFVYARCWLFSIRYCNPYAILMFTILTLGMFFIPANNQLFHSPGALFSLVAVVVLYGLNGHFAIARLNPIASDYLMPTQRRPDSAI